MRSLKFRSTMILVSVLGAVLGLAIISLASDPPAGSRTQSSATPTPAAPTLQMSLVYPASGVLIPGSPETIQAAIIVGPPPSVPIHKYRVLIAVRNAKGRVVRTRSYHPVTTHSLANINMKTLPVGSYYLSAEVYQHEKQLIETDPSVVTKQNSTPIPTNTRTATPAPTATASPDPPPTSTPTQKPTPTMSTTPVATRTATVTPTPTPTPTPSSVPTPTVNSQCAGANAFFVDLGGNDSTGTGSATNPWRTIQHCANTIRGGQTCCVNPGAFLESDRLSSTTGSSSSLKTITASILPSCTGVTSTTQCSWATTCPCEAGSGCPSTALFYVDGANWVIDHMDVSSQSTGQLGIWFQNSTDSGASNDATDDTAQYNYVHELCSQGIVTDKSTSHISILNNIVYHAETSGIMLDGSSNLLQCNDISGTEDSPQLDGGIYTACAAEDPPDEADADGIRYFGSDQEISENYIHDIYISWAAGGPSAGVETPHTDCFQTYTSGDQTAANNVMIERNKCIWPQPYYVASGNTATSFCTGAGTPYSCCTGNGTGCSLNLPSMCTAISAPFAFCTGSGTGGIDFSAYNGTNHYGENAQSTGLVTFQNNIFVNGAQGLDFEATTAGPVAILNNTFDHATSYQIIFGGTPAVNTLVENNMFYDQNDNGNPLGGGDGSAGIWFNGSTTNVTFDSNDCWLRSGESCTDPAASLHVEPSFISSGSLTGSNISSVTNQGATGAYYDLTSGSALIGAGLNLQSMGVTNDYLGNSRPATANFAVGAYEPPPTDQ